MELFDILEKDCCLTHLKGKHKEEVLHQLVTAAKQSPLLAGVGTDFLLDKFKAREEQGSTGFGEGIALPHIRIPGIDRFLVFVATSDRGVEFEALDGKRVRLLVVIIGPEEQVSEHVKLLATLSRVLNSSRARKELLAAATPAAVYENFLRHTRVEEGDALSSKRRMKLMLVILYLDEYLYQILEYFLEEGIDGATVLESSGMGQYISNVPLFANFIGFLNENKNRSKTILSLVPEDRVDAIIQGLEEITGDMDKKQGAMVLTLDISFYKGTMKIM